ncbi:MAG: tyrosine-type recombinase/integrase [Planctomycetaceae bacterium]|nr:tyrosine-type recombinase/integrase [Planctomycetaceae bacterium]
MADVKTETKKPRTKKRGAGEGSIFQRGDGKWTGTITVGYSEVGKRLRKTVYGETKKAVTDKLTRLQGQKLDGTLTTSGGQRLGEYFSAWVKNDTSIAETTRNRYTAILTKFILPRLGGMKLSAVRVEHVEAFFAGIRDEGASEATVRYVFAVLHRGFQRLIEQRRLTVHPCAALSRPKVDTIPRQSLDREQCEDLLKAAAGHRLEAVFVLAITTGLRAGELFGLQWDDVDLDHGTLTVRHSLEEINNHTRLKPPKSKAGLRMVRLPQMAIDSLRERWAAAMREDAAGVPFVFCGQTGATVKKSDFRRCVWLPIRKAAGLPDSVRFHDLRHTSASLMMQAGINPKVVQQRLGHSDIGITLRTYSHVMPGMDAAAAASFDGIKRGNPADGYKLATKQTSEGSTGEQSVAETIAAE